MDRYPLRVEAHRDATPSRWLWLVKWLLLIPHYIVLLVLWTGLVVLTLVAYLAVLFTGRYPAPIRAYNLGVLRWTWRVGYYGYQALGTDRYPPFTLADVPGHPARLHLEPGPPPPRWLPLVAWLFAVPHLIILGALSGGTVWTVHNGDVDAVRPLGVIGALLLVAGFALLFTGRYPQGLHDLLVGLSRWGLRVTAYLTLLTPRYPPFRLDQGESEPDPSPDAGPPAAAHRTSAAGAVVALVAGVLLLAPATGLTVGGGTLLALDGARDNTGYISSGTVRLDSGTAAITAENLEIGGADFWTDTVTDVGGLRVTADSANGRQIFLGIAAQDNVDAWLAGTAHDEMIGVTPGRGRFARASGTTRAATAPTAQSFWITTAIGADDATLRWTVENGEYAVVVANVDGSPGVAADVRGAIQTPDLTGLGAGLLTAGVVLGLAAIGLIVLGGVGLGHRHVEPPPGPGTAGPAPEPGVIGAGTRSRESK